jgi:hypothetical protein
VKDKNPAYRAIVDVDHKTTHEGPGEFMIFTRNTPKKGEAKASAIATIVE